MVLFLDVAVIESVLDVLYFQKYLIFNMLDSIPVAVFLPSSHTGSPDTNSHVTVLSHHPTCLHQPERNTSCYFKSRPGYSLNPTDYF